MEHASASRKCGHACKGAHNVTSNVGCAHPLHWSEREKEIKRERGERERGRERERKRGRERERCRIWLFLFLKGMTGALAPFSYLVQI